MEPRERFPWGAVIAVAVVFAVTSFALLPHRPAVAAGCALLSLLGYLLLLRIFGHETGCEVGIASVIGNAVLTLLAGEVASTLAKRHREEAIRSFTGTSKVVLVAFGVTVLAMAGLFVAIQAVRGSAALCIFLWRAVTGEARARAWVRERTRRLRGYLAEPDRYRVYVGFPEAAGRWERVLRAEEDRAVFTSGATAAFESLESFLVVTTEGRVVESYAAFHPYPPDVALPLNAPPPPPPGG